MLVSSWNKSLQAYGIDIFDTLADDLQLWHQDEYAKRPHVLQTSTSNASDDIIKRSIINMLAPYEIRQSRSISPRRRPPS